MTTTTFTDGITLTDDGWFNDVNDLAYEGTFPAGITAVTATGATTLSVFNTIATTINAFGAATTLSIGAATGTLTVNNTTLSAKALSVTTGAFSGTVTLTNASSAAEFAAVASTAATSARFKMTTNGNDAYIGREGTTPAFGAGSGDLFLYNGGLGLKVANGASPTVTIPNALSVGNNLDLTETSTPAGLSNTARLFSVDNGAGKTQLMVIFGSGAAQQIAIEA